MKCLQHLQTKLTIAILIAVILFISISHYYGIVQSREVIREQIDAYGISMSGTLANFSVENLLAWNYPAMQSAVENIGGYDPEIISIEIHQEGTIVAQYLSEEYKDEEVDTIYQQGVEYIAPVVVAIKGESINLGFVKIVLSEERYQSFLSQETRSSVVCGLILLFGITFLMYLFLHYLILRPIKDIERGARVIGKGNLEYRIKVASKDEIGMLAKAFNEMAVQLKQLRARDKLISKMKSEFISIAAHQLRTPLAAIKWTIKMILDGDMGKINFDVTEHLERTYQSNSRLISLMNALLDVSHLEQGKFLCDLKEASIEDTLKDIVGYSNELALERDIKIKLETPKESLPKIKVDSEKFALALQNLFNNAMKYSQLHSEVNVVLKHIKDETEEFIQIEIKDSGIGIDKEDQKRLFTKFFRAEKATRFAADGTGLGLFITKNIIEAHGGKIWFKSEEGKGTTFYVRLPVGFDPEL